jgi:lipopolysaccharide export system permease protein
MSGAETPSLSAGDRTLGFLLNPDLDDPHVIGSAGSYRSELHARLTEWLFPFMFALISLVVAGDSRSHRQMRIHPMVAALVVAFALRWVGFSFKNLVKQDEAYIFLMYLLPAATIGATTFMLITGRRPRIPNGLARMTTALWTRMQQLTARRVGGRA